MLLLSASLALAADPVDVGVIKNSDIKVVQRVLYTKDGKLEIGAGLGVMPFDGLTTAPMLALSGTMFLSETAGLEVQVAGGYGIPTERWVWLESFGVAVESYRYLSSVEADFQWSPIYAKMNLFGKKILHHEYYVLAGAGLTLEQSLIPNDETDSYPFALAPTVPIGLGTRVWIGDKLVIRAELRDNLMIERRTMSQTTAFKQNAAVTVGVGIFTGGSSK